MKIEGIILAAGLSSRMGKFKPGLKFNNKTLISINIEAMSAFCSTIIVVGGHQINALSGLVKNYSYVKVVENKN